MMTKVICLAAGLMLAGPAFASIIYDNPYDGSGNGNCEFSSICGAAVDDFAAQLFTISTGYTVTAGDFTELDFANLGGPSSVNWGIWTDTLSLPGTLLFSGTATISGSSNAGVTGGGLYIDTYTFDVPSIELLSGSYFFALQTTTTFFENNLAEGTALSGAAESKNDGSTWAAGYEGLNSVAVELDGDPAVPEPATLGFVAIGLGLLGMMRRLKTR